jgi:hypothetical protein
MKKLIFVATLATLAACAESEPAAEADTATDAVAEAPAPASEVMAADGQSPVGSYRITEPDGSVMTEELRADGTFTNIGVDGVERTGTWVQKSPALFCSTVQGETEKCYEEAVDAQGVWTSKDPESGEVSTIERVPVGG